MMESYLEGRFYQTMPSLDSNAFAMHEMQDETEQYLADLVPRRDSVLIANATMQRMFIEASNVPFAYEVYPSFYGSDYLCCPDQGSVLEWPISKRMATPQLVDKSANLVAKAVTANDAITWQFALVDRSRISLANPANALVSDPADYKYYLQEFAPRLPKSCRFINLGITDSDEYFAKYFHTDHHWQITGALDAYGKISDGFGRKTIEFGDLKLSYVGPFYGSEARSGLVDTYSDVVYDVESGFKGLDVEIDGETKDISCLNAGFSDKDGEYEPTDRFGNAYRDLFHIDCAELHIVNKGGKGTLLIIGDSFTNNFDYLYAATYRHVYVVDPRRCDYTLATFLKEHRVNDAVFVLASNTLLSNEMMRFLG